VWPERARDEGVLGGEARPEVGRHRPLLEQVEEVRQAIEMRTDALVMLVTGTWQ
jgi:hypothetical protein